MTKHILTIELKGNNTYHGMSHSWVYEESVTLYFGLFEKLPEGNGNHFTKTEYKNLLQIPSSRITFLLSLKVFTFITSTN
jgi:hypothetical protein